MKQSMQENDELRRRLQELADVNRKLAEYENRIALMSQELERISGALRSKSDEVTNWENRYRTLQSEYDGLKRSQSEL